MQIWYYHSPGQGRIGPLRVEELQQHYRERRMALDTLVWREGMREWQPADRLIDELGLIGIKPDDALPPPVPHGQPLSIVEVDDERFARNDSKSGTPWPSAPQQAPPAKSGMSGCLIAVIAIGVVGVVLIAILAAIALPAYKDYVDRTKRAQQAAADAAANANRAPTVGPPAAQTVYDAQQLAEDDIRVRALLAKAMGSAALQQGQCPQEFEFESAMVQSPELSGRFELSLFSADPFRCAYAVRFGPAGSEWANATAMYVAQGERGDISVSCRSNTNNPMLKPPGCN
ncbi:MAG: DUF4339 domain-containing protein [Lysobacter sp.]|nr:DUF4339 domain-containing protein [Lysobacter sp.]